MQVGEVDVCDPKRSDFVEFADKEKYPVLKGRVFFETNDMVSCLRENVELMNERYDFMAHHPEHITGGKYSDYGLIPKFIIFDEWAAFIGGLQTREFSAQFGDVDRYVRDLVLKGRQAGVFLILAMQRPDTTVLPGSLRDNFMTRLGLGRLSLLGQSMVHGDSADKKNFKYLQGELGRGYFSFAGSNIQEYYAPLVPFDQGFSFEEEFSKLAPIENKVKLDLEVSMEREKELTQLSQSGVTDKIFTLVDVARLLKQERRTVQKVWDLLVEEGQELTDELS